ncbi:MAG TPA: amino acid permease [Steroidobacteraceae bacterium]|nr:amino acid permease [Steroidobacteraceae bacterium]
MSEASPTTEPLARNLRGRHIQLIALGGTIGVGLFLGSARAIQVAGPGLLVNYAIAGAAVFVIMRALGELLMQRPAAGALALIAEEFVGPFAGFATGWSYWFLWVVVGMAELTAIGVYVHYWFPAIPQWLSALCTLLLLFGSNLLAVRVFGELEFWFAVIKITAIVGLIALGVFVLTCGGFGSLGRDASLANLWTHGGLFPHGALGLLLTLQIVVFAYSGVEVVAMTAGEAANPGVALPRATRSIIYRILIFYIGTLVVIMALIPWDRLSPTVSPFVAVFDRFGIPGGANVINFVVITAAASSCNSGLYSTGRMLYFLARRGQAPRAFARLSGEHVPANGVMLSAALMLVGVALNAVVPERAFIWVTSISLVGTLWTWIIILLAHLRYKRLTGASAAGRASGISWVRGCNWLVILFLLAVTGLLALTPDTRVALYVAPLWFALLGGVYRWRRGATCVATTAGYRSTAR